jgi:hypothetical protein
VFCTASIGQAAGPSGLPGRSRTNVCPAGEAQAVMCALRVSGCHLVWVRRVRVGWQFAKAPNGCYLVFFHPEPFRVLEDF